MATDIYNLTLKYLGPQESYSTANVAGTQRLERGIELAQAGELLDRRSSEILSRHAILEQLVAMLWW